MTRWRRRPPDPGPERAPGAGDDGDGPGTGVPGVTVTESGRATARDAGTSVTGHRGPARAAGSVEVSRTAPATASAGAVANSGYLAVGGLTVVQQAAPRPAAGRPHQVGVIPHRALSFQHRAAVQRLRAALDGSAVPSQVLTGTGGVGKTQLAADYARTAWERGEVDVLVWITANNRSATVAGYAQAATEILGTDPGDPGQAAKAFLAWLEPKAASRPCRWLVVLDDVADPADLRGLWPPAHPHGRTLTTTRRRDAALTGAGRRLLPVELFTPDEAHAYLTRVLAAHGRREAGDQLQGLAADLGRLPLALSQSAAYLVDAGLDCGAYRRLLARRAKKLAHLLPEPDALPDDQSTTVAAAWSLSVDRADRLHPAGLARPMLQLTAMLDPNGIPSAVLTSAPVLAHLTRHRARISRGSAPVTADDAVQALRALHRLNLIDHDPRDARPAVRVHRLVQRATREALTPDEHDRLTRTAADALLDAWPEIERDTAPAQALRANTAALAGQNQDALYRSGAHPVLFRADRSLGGSGQAVAARDHAQRLAAETRLRLGPEHADSLTARYHLAVWRGAAGDAAGAVVALGGLVEDQHRVLGPDHRDTLATRYNLAHWRGESGDFAGAVDDAAKVLQDQIRLLGPDHPDTLAGRCNLAHWRGAAGDPSAAAAALAGIVEDQIRLLGPDHPDTLTGRHRLSRWLAASGDAGGAATALTELLADRIRVLGPDHVETLATEKDLAEPAPRRPGAQYGPVMAARIDLTLDCTDAQLLAEFWRTALGYVDEPPPAPFRTREEWLAQFDLPADESADDGAWLCDPGGDGPRLSILKVPEPKRAKNRLHLDIRVPGHGSTDERWARVRAEADRLVRAGGTVLEEFTGHHVVMADPEGNEFCVAAAPA